MADAVTTTVKELPESRVRVEAEVSADEIQRRVEQTARALGRQLRIPGFRKGKVPAPVVIGRVGRETVLDEAVRESLGRWYAEAITTARVVTVGDPQIDLGDLPDEGSPLRFSVEIGVRPAAKLGEYKGLEVGRRETDVPDEAIDAEVQRLRESLGRLETVEEPAGEGEFVVVDFSGTVDGEAVEGLEGRDELVELGTGRLAEGMEEALVGAAAGDQRSADVDFPDDHQVPQIAGRAATFAMTVKEVKRKELPAVDDDLASDAAGFDTLAELREDIRAKLAEQETTAIEREFREAAVDAAVAASTVEVPDDLVAARAEEMWSQMMHALSHQGITEETYLRISGKDKDEVLAEARPDAEQALRREAVLAAVVEAEQIEPDENELLAALDGPAQQEKTTARKLLARLRSNGRVEELAADLATRRAVELIAESAKPIPAEQAAAREQIWTPGSASGEGSEAGSESRPAAPVGKLWTPGD